MLKQYLTNDFEIRRTFSGLIPVTSPIHLMIMKCLESRKMSFVDLKKNIRNLSSSALFDQLNSMCKVGLIAKDTLGRDVNYYICSKIVGSTYNHCVYTQFLLKQIQTLTDDPSTYLRKMTDITDVIWQELGINTTAITEKYGSFIADVARNELSSNTREELLMKLGKYTKRKNMHTITPYSFNPLSVFVECDTDAEEDLSSIATLTVGLVARSLENNQFGSYCSNLDSTKMEDGGLIIRLTPVENINDSDETSNVTVENSTEESDEEDYPFMIARVSGEKRVTIIPNALQIKMLQLLYDQPRCLQNLIDETQQPRSTLSQYAEQLIGHGLIKNWRNETGGIYYTINCQLILNKIKPIDQAHFEATLKDIITHDKIEIYDGLYLDLYQTITGAGVDNDLYWWALGVMFVDLLSHTYNGDLSEVYKKLEACMSIEDVKRTTICQLPLTIELRNHKHQVDTRYGVCLFYHGALKRFFELQSKQQVYAQKQLYIEGEEYCCRTVYSLSSLVLSECPQKKNNQNERDANSINS